MMIRLMQWLVIQKGEDDNSSCYVVHVKNVNVRKPRERSNCHQKSEVWGAVLVVYY